MTSVQSVYFYKLCPRPLSPRSFPRAAEQDACCARRAAPATSARGTPLVQTRHAPAVTWRTARRTCTHIYACRPGAGGPLSARSGPPRGQAALVRGLCCVPGRRRHDPARVVAVPARNPARHLLLARLARLPDQPHAGERGGRPARRHLRQRGPGPVRSGRGGAPRVLCSAALVALPRRRNRGGDRGRPCMLVSSGASVVSQAMPGACAASLLVAVHAACRRSCCRTAVWRWAVGSACSTGQWEVHSSGCRHGGAQMRGVHVTLRMRLECRIVRRGSKRAAREEVYEVLNEVVVDRGANPFLTKIECWERDRLITKVGPRRPPLAALGRAQCGLSRRFCVKQRHVFSTFYSGRGMALCIVQRVNECHWTSCHELHESQCAKGFCSVSTRHCSVAAGAEAATRAGASGWRHAGDADGQHRVLGGGGRLHGPSQRAGHPVHAHLPALAVVQARACGPRSGLSGIDSPPPPPQHPALPSAHAC